MLTERQLIQGLRLIPQQDQKRFFAALGNGKFSTAKFIKLMVCFAYAVGQINTSVPGTGIMQLGGGRGQNGEKGVLQATEAAIAPSGVPGQNGEKGVLQATEAAIASAGGSKRTIRQKVVQALPYVAMAVGVIGEAATFYYSTVVAPSRAESIYGRQTSECHSVFNFVTQGTAACAHHATLNRQYALTAASQISLAGYAAFAAIISYGTQLIKVQQQHGPLTGRDLVDELPLTGRASAIRHIYNAVRPGSGEPAVTSERGDPGRGRSRSPSRGRSRSPSRGRALSPSRAQSPARHSGNQTHVRGYTPPRQVDRQVSQQYFDRY